MRSLNTIAREIKLYWGSKVNYGAKPYLDFLANARTWRGEVAKRVKLELNTMLKG